MQLPMPRGGCSDALVDILRGTPRGFVRVPEPDDSPLDGDDFHLSLFVCAQLHQLGFDGVDDGWEWVPSLIRIRRELEVRFEEAMRDVVGTRTEDGAIADALRRIVETAEGPSMSRYLEARATPEQFREFVIHRSIYHLQEADPHTWAIPRTFGPAKAALVMIQADEYGNGDHDRMHSSLFAATMRALDLDTTPGAYVDAVPGATLATVNLMTTFGLQRRLRGALIGHLAAFEMTSTEPNLRYGNALRRFGYGPEATSFYDEHVTADEVHARIAAEDLAGAFVAQEPHLRDDVEFGARALMQVEATWASHVLDAWQAGGTSLLVAGAARMAV